MQAESGGGRQQENESIEFALQVLGESEISTGEPQEGTLLATMKTLWAQVDRGEITRDELMTRLEELHPEIKDFQPDPLIHPVRGTQ